MPTIRDRVLAYLLSHPAGADDRELTEALQLRNSAQANQRCHQLVELGLAERRLVRGRLRTYATGKAPLSPPPHQTTAAEDRPWFWEGNVQATVVAYLRAQGYAILRQADTASHETGRDIEAIKDGRTLWVTVKGYPRGTARSQPSTQAGMWFQGALFDVVVWRGQPLHVQTAVALPDFPRYRKLAERVRWLEPVARFFYLWVQEDGRVLMAACHRPTA